MDDLDLPAYFRRIGYAGTAATPDLATLSELIARHRTTIAFENIDPLAGRVPRLDLAALQAKLVAQRRGGYCFEQNHLFRAVLERLGYRVDGLEGRVRIGVASGAADTARSHMVLRVTLAGVAWLVDVGLGGPTPLAALRQDERGAQTSHGESFRIADVDQHGEPLWLMQAAADDGWQDVYVVHRRVVSPVDYEVSNWYVATNPASQLKRNLIVSRPGADGSRFGLRNDRLLSRLPGHAPRMRRLTDRADFADTLREVFGVEIDEAGLDAVMATIERVRAEEHAGAS